MKQPHSFKCHFPLFLATYNRFDCISFWQENIKRNKNNIFLYKKSDLFSKHCPVLESSVVAGPRSRSQGQSLGCHLKKPASRNTYTKYETSTYTDKQNRTRIWCTFFVFCFYKDLNSSYSSLSNISLDGMMEMFLLSYYRVHR